MWLILHQPLKNSNQLNSLKCYPPPCYQIAPLQGVYLPSPFFLTFCTGKNLWISGSPGTRENIPRGRGYFKEFSWCHVVCPLIVLELTQVLILLVLQVVAKLPPPAPEQI